jgi:NADH-quinone oxidoreductase subunit N
MNAVVTVNDFLHILPIISVAAWACLVLLADALGRSRSARLGPLAILGLVLALGVCVWSWIVHPEPTREVFGGMLIVDRYSLFFDMLFIVAGILTVLMAGPYQRAHGFAFGEHHSLLLLVITGMMLLIHAGDFVILVIGLETMSIGVYALVASWEGNPKSAEGGLKYYVMGAVASAFLLYGIALIYGTTGKTDLEAVGAAAPGLEGNLVFLLGMFMVLAALAFKVALVPFHGWTPDAYEGAPTTVTGFMAAAVKAAGFGVFLRVLLVGFGSDAYVFGFAGWADILKWLAILTMTLGNLAALRQSNIKRMLAYSSIAHAGYILIGVIAAGVIADAGGSSMLYYLLAYTFTTLGAFGVVAWIGSRGDERVDIDSWAGLGSRHPVAAAAMTLFLLSLGGVPPTAGFFAKFYLFRAALEHQGLLPLVIIAVLNSVVSFYYYLRPVVQMYFRDPGSQPGAAALPPAPLRSGGVTAALVIAVIFVLMLGLVPHNYLVWAGQAAAGL